MDALTHHVPARGVSRARRTTGPGSIAGCEYGVGGTAGGGLLAWMVVTKPKRVTTALENDPKEVWSFGGARVWVSGAGSVGAGVPAVLWGREKTRVRWSGSKVTLGGQGENEWMEQSRIIWITIQSHFIVQGDPMVMI